MGIKVNPFAVGLNPQVQFNNSRVYFGNISGGDSFQNTSVERYYTENAIKSMLVPNIELQKLLVQHKLPIHLNMEELRDLQLNHCTETRDIAAQIAKNLPPALKDRVNLKDLKDGAMLHDIGKVLIPREILDKEGQLTDEERKIMDLHSELGYLLLKNTNVNAGVLELVRAHHNIPENIVPDVNLEILSLADKYSALTEKRVYKPAMTPHQALFILSKHAREGEINPFVFNALVQTINDRKNVKVS